LLIFKISSIFLKRKFLTVQSNFWDSVIILQVDMHPFPVFREYGEGEDGDTHSTIRRQSVIIEGLTMETDELRVRHRLENSI
jgi:hypothetical protein